MATKDNLNNSLPLPADSMPECWSRDERMNALFAEFRNRSVNSQDWDSKYKFWEKLISDWLSSKQRCIFSVADLKVTFKRNGRTPLCLTTVAEELLRNGEIISETQFLKDSSSGWTAWAIDTMIKKPMVWSFSKLKNYIVKDVIDVDAKYIHMKTLKELANLILSTINEDNDNVLLSLSQITKNCIQKSGNTNITETNVKMALLWLRRSNRATFRGEIFQESNEFLVKISINGVKEVSEAEQGLFKLMEQEKFLIKNIERLETERYATLIKAKTSLANGMRELAKTCIRKRQEIDKTIEKRAAALQNVQTLIARIQDANSNTDILAAYKTGSNILKSYENIGLNEQNVTNTMDDISEAVGELADLQDIISTTIGTRDTDLELEEELRDLLETSPANIKPREKGNNILPDLSNLPDLQSELSALNLEEFPPPPLSTLQSKTFNTSLQKDNPT
ncbi:charged multivesicular body protein 7 [Venturia canescens]|uniref:charged multivesicular body protein 7 n=1 Tax=Venturia canescens TaxID=32260 RepID=UPI001C9C41EB|nr:charged multivesicular body protein 7 [Venturia canescens]